VVVLVLEREIDEAHRSRLIALAEDGPDLGVHMIWVADDIACVPAACRSFVEVTAQSDQAGTASFVRFGRTVALSRIEYVGVADALMFARSLAPVDDTAARALDESDLPRSVNLRELHRVDVLGGAGPILQSWQSAGSLISMWQQGEERDAVKIAAVVGQGAEGPVEIDLRVHGPHALVGGTTGAGKSEFLQSWIMSLAANVSPDRLTFLLVDYKGGAAFAECVDLPHTVGLVTDLSPHLVRRALTSLRAELRYREELLVEHGAKDLITMEKRGDAAAPPVLVIVIDEFAALASEVPEFVDGVIDVAQRGRSLGLHLIMATQRPAGVIKENLRANTNLRVALRMADEADSADVIGVKDAAFFDAETPGRGAVKSGAGRISHFQTGYLGGRSVDEMAASRLEIRDLGFVEGDVWDIPDGTSIATRKSVRRSQTVRDIERLRDGVIAAAEIAGLARPRKPWLEMLPTLLSLDELDAMRSRRGSSALTTLEPGVLIGMRDQPDAQRQEPVLIDLDDAGNIAIYGASGTGKTSALLAFAASISKSAAELPAHIYAIDAAGGGLDPLLALPTVGAIAPLTDNELTRRVLRRLQESVRERGTRFAAARANTLRAYCQATGTNEPRVVLLIDGFSVFRQSTEMLGSKDAPMQLLTEIMQAGRAVGVHVVLTADRAGVLPSSLAASVQQQLVLRLASVNEYFYVDVPADTLEAAPPGRGVFAGQKDEVQLALVSEAPELFAQAQALEKLALRLRAGQVCMAPPIQNAPTYVALHELPVQVDSEPVFGIETDGFTPVPMPISGLGVIAGPAGSGLSTAALACANGYVRWSAAEGVSVERVLLSFVPDLAGGLGGKAEWDRVARGAGEVSALAKELVEALGGTLQNTPGLLTPGLMGGPIGGSTSGFIAGSAEAETSEVPPAKARFPRRAARGVIVVERPTEAEGTEALPILVALAKTAKRADVLVLFEFEQGAAAGVWDLYSALKQPRWGLALQPDEGDGGSPFRENFGRVQRADFPVGCGFAVESGRIQPVLVATP
jgi:S-DNA-T family DNA segregation ATPase FtsK/SpoIIIE